MDDFTNIFNTVLGTKTQTSTTTQTAPPSNTAFYIVAGLSVLAIAGIIFYYVKTSK